MAQINVDLHKTLGDASKAIFMAIFMGPKMGLRCRDIKRLILFKFDGHFVENVKKSRNPDIDAGFLKFG